ncbi:hypothetical protein A4A49_59028, partial [Nicotiana attenuata]
GVIRNSKGEWIAGYHNKIHALTPLQVELQPIQQAFQLILPENLLPVEVEMDATNVMHMLVTNYPTYKNLISQCRRLMEQAMRKGEVVLKHNLRGGNMVAHILSKEALTQTNINKLFVFVRPPNYVVDAYHKDQEGFCYVRNISTSVCCKLATLGNENARRSITVAQCDSNEDN